jgi:hypothetical protein
MEHAAHQAPFGPFPKDDPKGDIDRQTSGIVDMRGAADWRAAFTVDCGAFSWGQLAISCDAAPSPTVAHAFDLPNLPWVEVRIEFTINGATFVYLEGAVGGVDAAAGPIVIGLGLGEVPDTISLSARARRGGLAELAGDLDERLALVATSRFHR